jgi:hypothetical protein
MSNISLEDMARIYKMFLPHFVTISEEAEHHNVCFSLITFPDGTIAFVATEPNGHTQIIKQNRDQESFSYKFGNI